MMKKLLVAFLLVSITSLFANDVQVFSQKNIDGKITPKTIEAEFKKLGFYISDNRDMNKPFMIQFKQTDFKVYNLFTLYHIDSVYNLAKKYPKIGLFTPMSMSIYTKKGDDTIHVSSLTVETMSRISGIPASNPDLQKIGMLVKKALKIALPNGKFETFDYKSSKTAKELITKMHVEVDPEDWEDETEGMIEMIEGGLEEKGFVQAGFTDINYDFKKMGDDYFDMFVSESICKLPVIYAVAKTRPEAGAFAPCSISIYKRKGENIMYVEYPNVYNWIASLTIDDKNAIKELIEAQAKMEVILYNAKE
jgi:uncharacterized protein (DUF302 family)